MNNSSLKTNDLIKYALQLTRRYKENITPHFDNLTYLHTLIDRKVKRVDVDRFNFNNRDQLVCVCMKINVDTYMPNAVINMRSQPQRVYCGICQKCYQRTQTPPSPDNPSVYSFLCGVCGACLMIKHPLNSDSNDDSNEETMEF
ncbi:ORF-128 [Catopsilia pomona nucleopolyhedrovirus]|uniref:ORF-128 n=1 Tax=Catopsilia pomona nucleopolyhedrovirus TaxID=1850906 RepID=A0A172WZK5_9ABAC|nr:ORF-128 [Catopsilia pomona nucleopolyhedrovirus]ANF29776.1 ORF-128 [Catopsilia pomona nucleopolyhedrovirus]